MSVIYKVTTLRAGQPRPYADVLDDFIVKVVAEASTRRGDIIEQRIRILLQPKPRWLPEAAWRAVLRRVLVLEEVEP